MQNEETDRVLEVLEVLQQPMDLIDQLRLRLDRLNEIARQANRSIQEGRYGDLDRLVADCDNL